MYKVLLPLDDDIDRSNQQASYAINLPCSADEVEVILSHTLTSEERDAPEAMKRVDRVETVRRAQERLEEAGVTVDTRELSSPPADAILSMADDEDIDEIVMGGRKRSPAEKAILGSITQKVILNAEIPVAVTGGS
jgi:nucleotide-binding universal stress UspA family protein